MQSKNMRHKKYSSSVVHFTLYIIFFSIISYLYISDIAPFWGYYGYQEIINYEKITISIVSLALWSLLFKPKDTVSDLIIYFAIFLYIIPSFVMYSFGGNAHKVQAITIMSLLIIFMFAKIKIRRFTIYPVSPRTIFIIILIFVLFSMALQLFFGGISTFNLNIWDVYQFRTEAASNVPAIFGYIISPTGKILLPMGFVLSAYFGSRSLAILFGILTIGYFGISQHKSILFAPFLVYFIYLATMRYGGRKSIQLFFLTVLALLLLNHIGFIIFTGNSGTSTVNSLILRRTLFTPVLLDSFYIDFFTQNNKYYWASSAITFGIIDNDYYVNAPFLIGKEYFGNELTSANSGIVSSGFYNAGVFGVMLYSIIFGLILSALNSHARKIGHSLIFSIALVPTITIITSTDLITSILTHGILALFLMLMIFPSKSYFRQSTLRGKKIEHPPLIPSKATT